MALSAPAALAPPWLMRDISVELRYAYHAEVDPVMLDLRTRHPFFTWWWCERGRARVRSAGRDDVIRPGEWVLFTPHCERHHRIDPHTVLVSVSFEAVWSTGVPLVDMRGPLVSDGRGHRPLYRAAENVCRARHALRADPGKPGAAMKAGPSSAAACRLQGRLLVFAAELIERAAALGCTVNPSSSGDDRLDTVLKEMRSQLSAGPLPWSDWARRVGLSRSQLDRLSRQAHGVSLRQRRDQLLLDELRQRLRVGRGSIKEVAAALGFVDTAHLCRWTRNHTGRSPRDIRREAMA